MTTAYSICGVKSVMLVVNSNLSAMASGKDEDQRCTLGHQDGWTDGQWTGHVVLARHSPATSSATACQLCTNELNSHLPPL